LRHRYEKVNIILLITDRKSFALDVHALARFGRRVCLVLIGEDSLEANVGFTVPLRIIEQGCRLRQRGPVGSLALCESTLSH
jgi:hypothetical protein